MQILIVFTSYTPAQARAGGEAGRRAGVRKSFIFLGCPKVLCISRVSGGSDVSLGCQKV